jgi:Flp pilus assembly protein TadB
VAVSGVPAGVYARDDRTMQYDAASTGFLDSWNALDRMERAQLRRLVRMGRSSDDPRLDALATDYARHQIAQPWMRFFWMWFVPGVVIALGVAANVHPILVGVALVLAAQAVWAYFSLRKAARAVSDR